MSSRVLREGIWSSEAVNALHDKTFRLYVCLLNAADDFGLVEIGFGAIKASAPLLSWTREEVGKLLGELSDHGLILPYEHDSKQFAAITKWQAWIRSVKPRNPIPTWGTTNCLHPLGFKDERTRVATAKYFSHLPQRDRDTPGIPQGNPRGSLGVQQGGKGLRVKGKGSNSNPLVGFHPTIVDPKGFSEFWAAYPHYSGRSSKKLCRQIWDRLKLEPHAQRILETVRRARESPDWKREGGKYVKGAQAWLNLQLWAQDDLGEMGSGSDSAMRRAMAEMELELSSEKK